MLMMLPSVISAKSVIVYLALDFDLVFKKYTNYTRVNANTFLESFQDKVQPIVFRTEWRYVLYMAFIFYFYFFINLSSSS